MHNTCIIRSFTEMRIMSDNALASKSFNTFETFFSIINRFNNTSIFSHKWLISYVTCKVIIQNIDKHRSVLRAAEKYFYAGSKTYFRFKVLLEIQFIYRSSPAQLFAIKTKGKGERVKKGHDKTIRTGDMPI